MLGLNKLQIKFKITEEEYQKIWMEIENISQNIKETKERLFMGHEDPLLTKINDSK